MSFIYLNLNVSRHYNLFRTEVGFVCSERFTCDSKPGGWNELTTVSSSYQASRLVLMVFLVRWIEIADITLLHRHESISLDPCRKSQDLLDTRVHHIWRALRLMPLENHTRYTFGVRHGSWKDPIHRCICYTPCLSLFRSNAFFFWLVLQQRAGTLLVRTSRC